MRVHLSPQRRAALLRSLQGHFADEFDETLSEFRAAGLLEFFVGELGPPCTTRGFATLTPSCRTSSRTWKARSTSGRRRRSIRAVPRAGRLQCHPIPRRPLQPMPSSACPACRRRRDSGTLFCAGCGHSVAARPAVTWTTPRQRRSPLVLAAVAAGLAVSTLAVTGVRAWRAVPEGEPWTAEAEVVTSPRLPMSGKEGAAPQLLNAAEVSAEISRLYPPLLRDAGLAGDVQVPFRVRWNGTVDAASVETTAATHVAFGEAAQQVVQKMRFLPAIEDGKAVDTVVVLPIHFRIEP